MVYAGRHTAFFTNVRMQKLVNRGIRATVRPLKPLGQGDTQEMVHVLYVQLADEEAARAFLDGSVNFNGN